MSLLNYKSNLPSSQINNTATNLIKRGYILRQRILTIYKNNYLQETRKTSLVQ